MSGGAMGRAERLCADLEYLSGRILSARHPLVVALVPLGAPSAAFDVHGAVDAVLLAVVAVFASAHVVVAGWCAARLVNELLVVRVAAHLPVAVAQQRSCQPHGRKGELAVGRLEVDTVCAQHNEISTLAGEQPWRSQRSTF